MNYLAGFQATNSNSLFERKGFRIATLLSKEYKVTSQFKINDKMEHVKLKVVLLVTS
jgi:hypothetical protein